MHSLGSGYVILCQRRLKVVTQVALTQAWCAGGDAMFQQVEVDMFRMAALFVVERLKPWLMTYLAALLATAAPAPLVRQASGKCEPLLILRNICCPILTSAPCARAFKVTSEVRELGAVCYPILPATLPCLP